MKITPLDIQQHSFSITMRGYDTREVDMYLEMVGNEMEKLIRENHKLNDEFKKMENMLAEFQEKERILKETMISAQKMSEDLKENAKKEAALVISKAENESEKILEKAYSRLAKVIEDINEMKRQRVQFETSLKSILETHMKILEIREEEIPSEIENKLKIMKKNEKK